jgi:AcrR family transcriptional regulator
MEQSTKTSVDLQRTQLLDAAAHLFATKGFHGTGMRELARHLKIKAGSLYYHITSKDQLLDEICEIGMDRLSSNVDRASAGNSGFPETIRSIIVGHAQLIKRYGSYLSCYQNEYAHLSADVREKMRLELVAFHRKIDDVFKRAIAQRETSSKLVVKNARLALIAILHQLSRLGSEQHQSSLNKTAEGLSEILIYGLASKRSDPSRGMEAQSPPPP